IALSFSAQGLACGGFASVKCTRIERGSPTQLCIEQSFLAVVSGERRGPLGALLRGLLRLAALVYALAIALRAALYRLGLKRPARAGNPVLCVGNLVAGGTGQTPVGDHVAR